MNPRCDKCRNLMDLENRSQSKYTTFMLFCCRACGYQRTLKYHIGDDIPPIPEAAKELHVDPLTKWTSDQLHVDPAKAQETSDNFTYNDEFMTVEEALEQDAKEYDKYLEEKKGDLKKKKIKAKPKKQTKKKKKPKKKIIVSEHGSVSADFFKKGQSHNNFPDAEPWGPFKEESKVCIARRCSECGCGHQNKVDEMEGKQGKYTLWECPDCGHTDHIREAGPGTAEPSKPKPKKKVQPGLGQRKVKFDDA